MRVLKIISVDSKMIKRRIIWSLDVEINKYICGYDMENWLAKRMDDVDNLHVEIEKS